MLKLIGQPSVEERAFALTRTAMPRVFTDGSHKRTDDARLAVWRKAMAGRPHCARKERVCSWPAPRPGQNLSFDPIATSSGTPKEFFGERLCLRFGEIPPDRAATGCGELRGGLVKPVC